VCRRGVHLIAAQRACNGTRHKQLHMTSRAVACAASRFSSARTRSDSHWARLTDSKIVALFLRKAMYGGQGAGSACASSADTAAEASAHQPWASPQRSAPSAARAPLPAPPALRQTPLRALPARCRMRRRRARSQACPCQTGLRPHAGCPRATEQGWDRGTRGPAPPSRPAPCAPPRQPPSRAHPRRRSVPATAQRGLAGSPMRQAMHRLPCRRRSLTGRRCTAR